MSRYQVYYQNSEQKKHNLEPKIALIEALTEQSAASKFSQMYHECWIVDVKEVNDEG